MNRLEGLVRQFIAMVADRLAPGSLEDLHSLNQHGEPGIALENAIDNLFDAAASVSSEEYRVAADAFTAIQRPADHRLRILLELVASGPSSVRAVPPEDSPTVTRVVVGHHPERNQSLPWCVYEVSSPESAYAAAGPLLGVYVTLADARRAYPSAELESDIKLCVNNIRPARAPE